MIKCVDLYREYYALKDKVLIYIKFKLLQKKDFYVIKNPQNFECLIGYNTEEDIVLYKKRIDPNLEFVNIMCMDLEFLLFVANQMNKKLIKYTNEK